MNMNVMLKWIGAGLIAATVSSLAIFTKFGSDLVNALVMIALGIGVYIFIGAKKLGQLSFIPAGLVVAGAITLGNTYIVPYIQGAEAPTEGV